MGVQFLSEEWAKAVQDALNGNESFKAAATAHTASIQQVITDAPGGEKKYWIKLDGGNTGVGVGDIGEAVDATITQDYATAVGISKNELSAIAAYMSGKLQIAGDLMKLMQLQAVLGQLPQALKDLDVDF